MTEKERKLNQIYSIVCGLYGNITSTLIKIDCAGMAITCDDRGHIYEDYYVPRIDNKFVWEEGEY